MSQSRFHDKDWEKKLREARELHDSFSKAKLGKKNRGNKRAASRRGGLPSSSQVTRNSENAKLFSPSPYTPRPGISAAFPGRGGFSSSGISSTSLFSNNAPASTTQSSHLHSQKVQASVVPPAYTKPVADQISTQTASQNIKNQSSPSKHPLTEQADHDSANRARIGFYPFPPAITAERSYSSDVTTLQEACATQGSASVVTPAALKQRVTDNHGGLSASRFSSANSQAPTVKQSIQSVTPVTTHLGSQKTVTAATQNPHLCDVSETDVEMKGVKEPLKRHGGLKQSRFAETNAENVFDDDQQSLPGSRRTLSDNLSTNENDIPRWVPSRVVESTHLPLSLQNELALLKLATNREAEPSANSTTSKSHSQDVLNGTRRAEIN